MACLYSSIAASTARSRGDSAGLAVRGRPADGREGAVGSAAGSSRQAGRARTAASVMAERARTVYRMGVSYWSDEGVGAAGPFVTRYTDQLRARLLVP